MLFFLGKEIRQASRLVVGIAGGWAGGVFFGGLYIRWLGSDLIPTSKVEEIH